LENKKSPADVPTADDLKPYFANGKLPQPVMGETYVLGRVSEPVTADVDARQAKQFAYLANKLPSGGAEGKVVQLSADGSVTVVSEAERQAELRADSIHVFLDMNTPVDSAERRPIVTYATPHKLDGGPISTRSVQALEATPPPPVVSSPGVAQNRLGVDLAGKPPTETEIVLLKTEATPEYTFEGGATVTGSAAVAPTITESQAPPSDSFFKGNIVGYVNVTAAASAAPAAPQAPAEPNEAVGPGGVVEGYVDTSANWNTSLQAPNSFANNIVENNGNIQNQVATVGGVEGVANLNGLAGGSGAGGGGRGGRGGGRGGGGGFGGGRGGGGGGGAGVRAPYSTANSAYTDGNSGGAVGGSANANESPVAVGGNFSSPSYAISGANGPQANIDGTVHGTGTTIIRENGNLADQAREVLRKRVDQFGIVQPVISANPGDQMVLLNDSGTAPLHIDPQTGYPVPADTDYNGVPPAYANPMGQFPGNTANATVTTTTTTGFGLAGQSGIAAAQNQAGDQARFYRSQAGQADAEKSQAQGFDWYLGNSENGTAAANGGNGSEKDKVPGLGDMPVMGKAFASSAPGPVYAPTPMTPPAPSGAPAQAGTEFFDDSYTAGNWAEAAKTVHGENAYSGGTVDNAGTLAFSSGTLSLPQTTTVKGLPSDRDQAVYVAKLNNADPNQAAQVLRNMFTRGAPPGSAPPGTTSALMNRAQNTASSMGNANQSTGIGTVGGGGGHSFGGGDGGAYNNNGTVGAQISVDPVTHNLVVIADKETEDQINKVLASLDKPSRQELVETRLIETSPVTATATPPGYVALGGTNAVVMNGDYFLVPTNFAGTSVPSLPANSSTNDISLNFQNVPLDMALNYLSEQAGFVIVQDKPVHGTVTLSGNHLTQDQAVDLLNSELNRNGYAAMRNGRVLTIVDKNDAKASDLPMQKAPPPPPIPQPEIQTSTNAFSTFSMNVSDVSFKLAEASLQKGRMPDAASIRSEEFINAFDYRDPEAAAGQPVAFTSERARYPFAQNRDLLRFSIKTAAAGREANRPLNLVLLLDTSGSMERADRVEIIREAMRVLAAQLHPRDTVSVVTFARIARLWADGVAGDKAGETLARVGGITPEGGTNLEEAMNLAYQTALRHYLANGANRVVLLTDGAANLGNVNPGALKQKVESFRKQGIALDCFGIGWEDYDDNMLAELSGNGDGRYAFLNTPEEAGTEFAAKLAGALQVAAQDVKVQVEFNPQRVVSWRQIGYAKHQLTKEQFRDNSVLAAEIAAQEAGNALYTVEIKPDGFGPVATVYVRYKVPGTMEVEEHSWYVPYDGNAPALEQSSPAMRLAATASAFSEWLAGSPYAQEVTPDELLRDLSGVPQIYGADQRPRQLEWMIRQAMSLLNQPRPASEPSPSDQPGEPGVRSF